jgi:3-isopropylmalate/(R)-2-methylmalate dehydratase small subunit
MQTRFQGRSWVLPDDVDTDQITPGKYLTILEEEELGKHVLEGYDEDFPGEVEAGDVIVAGRNFGCGSSREHAPRAIKGAGIPVVVAESFARIFFRNAVNIGLPILEAPGVTDIVTEGDPVTVDLEEGSLRNDSSGEIVEGQPLQGKALEILEAGGLVPLTRQRLQAQDDD